MPERAERTTFYSETTAAGCQGHAGEYNVSSAQSVVTRTEEPRQIWPLVVAAGRLTDKKSVVT